MRSSSDTGLADFRWRSPIQAGDIGELLDQPIDFDEIAFDYSPLICAERHLLKVSSDGRFAFQRLASCTLFRKIEVATCTCHSVWTGAPEGIGAVRISEIIEGVRFTALFAGHLVIDKHGNHVCHVVSLGERGGQLCQPNPNVMHGGCRRVVPRPLH
jgi:hypothetical protein